MTSIQEINLQPKEGKRHWQNCHREWREEFIYFILVDRFHDSHNRRPQNGINRQSGFGRADELQKFCGGTIRGIIDHLDYIDDLGCTALWLSPLFENNPQSYHGYAIQNYLEVDKRFGTKQDLEELVDKAHALDMRVFLDIVLHHSGDTWFYPEDVPYYYYEGAVFPFGGWRYEDSPVPAELRNPELYARKGRIRNFDAVPETRDGDFSDLKTFTLNDSPQSLWLQELLVKIHCYWIREVDVDGFRIDAVKHMSEIAISRFCSSVREYAYKLGKKNFFFFGELVGSENLYNNYIGPKTPVAVNDKTIYYGLNSVLDFPLHHILPDVILGNASPKRLIERYESLRQHALHRGEFGEFLVTFLDNHDQVGQAIKRRFGKDANIEQIIAGIGFLLCALGTPCIYYGTEQGFDGSGEGDWFVREAMFNLSDETANALNKDSYLYKGISQIANLRKKNKALKFGRMQIRPVSINGHHFHLPECKECLLAFSRILFDDEIIVAYNISSTRLKTEYIQVELNGSNTFRFLIGDSGTLPIHSTEDRQANYIQLNLKPLQFVILERLHE
jgi:alpha-amylase